MDWARAKTILIIIFLLLNIFLLFTIIYTNSNIRMRSDYAKYALKYLESKNIKLEAQMPNMAYKAGTIAYAGIRFDFDKITQLVFGHKVRQTNQGNNISYIEKGAEVILKNDLLTIQAGLANAEAHFSKPEALLEAAYKYLTAAGLKKSNLLLKKMEHTDNEIKMTISQKYQAGVLFDLDIHVVLDRSGTLSLNMPAVEVQRSTLEKEILSPYQILVMGGLPENCTIKKVEFGYKRIQKDEINDSPVWLVVLSDGQAFYYNAYSGEKLP